MVWFNRKAAILTAGPLFLALASRVGGCWPMTRHHRRPAATIRTFGSRGSVRWRCLRTAWASFFARGT